ncbi:sigma-70 family RNA polymerase sigma factor [Caproicibacterium amylolyticum]|uniref:Sigma-70 family RNA polymerase sigma factor n=1 Tax=Caproicibacterium amylolyticum TaxID=2766537 RepID=A0A7G9WJU0_9FIRM|nr:sigma-70 family RNA polymerase sigma factor [Caproicibacterium amylolyticum]QNO18952.1 sigma-70 family RNA polymerase sigma factor [Caproicibacterium amylolyticum]
MKRVPIEPLTESEQKTVEENEKLIYAFLNRKRLEIDEWYGDCAIGLIKAAKTYKVKSQNKFSTYAFSCMWNEVKHRYAINGAKKRVPDFMVISMNTPIPGTFERTVTVGDSLESTDIVAEVDGVIDIKSAMKRADQRITPKMRSALHLYMMGYSMGDISRKWGVTTSAVGVQLNKARKAIKDEIKKSASVTAITNAEKP